MLHHHRAHTATCHVLPDRFGQQAGHMLVVFVGHGTQLIPSLLIHF